MSDVIVTFHALPGEEELTEKLDKIVCALNILEDKNQIEPGGKMMSFYVQEVYKLYTQNPTTVCRYMIECARQFPPGSAVYYVIRTILFQEGMPDELNMRRQNADALYAYAELCRVGYFKGFDVIPGGYEYAAKKGHKKAIDRLRQQKMANAAKMAVNHPYDLPGYYKIRRKDAEAIYERLVDEEGRMDFVTDLLFCYETLGEYDKMISLSEKLLSRYPYNEMLISLRKECKRTILKKRILNLLRLAVAVIVAVLLTKVTGGMPLLPRVSAFWLSGLLTYFLLFHPAGLFHLLFSIIGAPCSCINGEALIDMVIISTLL